MMAREAPLRRDDPVSVAEVAVDDHGVAGRGAMGMQPAEPERESGRGFAQPVENLLEVIERILGERAPGRRARCAGCGPAPRRTGARASHAPRQSAPHAGSVGESSRPRCAQRADRGGRARRIRPTRPARRRWAHRPCVPPRAGAPPPQGRATRPRPGLRWRCRMSGRRLSRPIDHVEAPRIARRTARQACEALHAGLFPAGAAHQHRHEPLGELGRRVGGRGRLHLTRHRSDHPEPERRARAPGTDPRAGGRKRSALRQILGARHVIGRHVVGLRPTGCRPARGRRPPSGCPPARSPDCRPR